MSTTFLNCVGEAYFNLRLVVRNQDKDGLKETSIDVKSNCTYKITVADNEYGINTYDCRIVGFTIANKPDNRSLVNYDKKGNIAKYCEVDTIKIDCSEDGRSEVRSINVADIRSIEEFSTDGIQDVTTIENFK